MSDLFFIFISENSMDIQANRVQTLYGKCSNWVWLYAEIDSVWKYFKTI